MTADRAPASDREVRARRARALARLAERRRADEERSARARAMARHPAGGSASGAVAATGTDAAVASQPAILQAVR